MIKLGDMVRDKVTGFKGIAMGRTTWLNGCNTVGVKPAKLDKDGKQMEMQWFDEPQLTIMAVAKVRTNTPVPATGGPKPTPHRGH